MNIPTEIGQGLVDKALAHLEDSKHCPICLRGNLTVRYQPPRVECDAECADVHGAVYGRAARMTGEALEAAKGALMEVCTAVQLKQARAASAQVAPPRTFRALAVSVGDDWMTEPLPPREHLLTDSRTGRGAVDRTGTWLFAGAGGAGKSYATIDLGMAVATGGSWYGLDTSGRPGRVLMIVAEDAAEDVRRRLHRIATARYSRARLDGRITILPLRGEGLALVAQARDGSCARSAAAEALLAYVAEERASSGAPYDLVTVDPLARVAGVSLDKDSAAATAVIDVLDRLSDIVGGLALATHHTSKLSRTLDKPVSEAPDVRGSTALVDGARGVIQILAVVDGSRRPTGQVILSCTKANHVAKWPDIILERGDGGVLGPVSEIDRALYEAGQRGTDPTTSAAAREAEREAQKDRQAAADVERAARRRADNQARREAEARDRVAADAIVVRQIIAEGYAGKLRDAVKLRIGCGQTRAEQAMRAAVTSANGEATPSNGGSARPPQPPPIPPLVPGSPGHRGGDPGHAGPGDLTGSPEVTGSPEREPGGDDHDPTPTGWRPGPGGAA